ncbi:MAG TPA: type 1 glutamine amidotransferase domain-containing protein [Streptosporangiaceae bacterium]|jgi:protease I
MANALESMKIAFLAAGEGTEQAELVKPWHAVLAHGGEPVLVSEAKDKIQMFEHLDRADTQEVDVHIDDAQVQDYAGLVLPGGVANPDRLRTIGSAVAFVRGFFEAGKPVAAICHAPWMLVEAGVLAGRTLTSWPSLKTDITNAGGRWVDEEVVVCTRGPNPMVTSRKPGDLPAFNTAFTRIFAEARTR